MKIVADIHLHSHFSRATSKTLDLEHLSKWAQLKGVQVVGTGDIAHPGWLDEMKQKLRPAEDGLFELRTDYGDPIQTEVPKACRGPVRFMLAGEISNIYKKNDKVRKIHNVVFLPTFEAVEKFQARLEKIGNIRSDGRPILGLDARDLLEIVLETDPQGFLIPAHIWTPWFALLGSMSGFDTVDECFADLTEHIFAVETGLSSDPPMNWRLSMLDKYTLVSNSDAHSPPKLAREATVFDTELSYTKLFEAMKTGNPGEFSGTIEFFPEEGKYHYDGHRKCGVRWHPETTLKNDTLCPECGRKVTVGVMHRVEKLADRAPEEEPDVTSAYQSLIPLPEVLAEIHGVGVNTKRVKASMDMLLSKLGPELHILQDVPLPDLEKLGGAILSEGIRRMRNGEVKIAAGYDGEYGKITMFDEEERGSYSSQISFFEKVSKQHKDAGATDKLKVHDSQAESKSKSADNSDIKSIEPEPASAKKASSQKHTSGNSTSIIKTLHPEQKAAVEHTDGPLVIVAGPGTGKTTTLTHRIASLIARRLAQPQNILAVTFTNKAAEEMLGRLKLLLSRDSAALTIKTFHALAAMILRESGASVGIDEAFAICNAQTQKSILKELGLGTHDVNRALDAISYAKNHLQTPELGRTLPAVETLPAFPGLYESYQTYLRENNLLDYDDLILFTVKLFNDDPNIRANYEDQFQWIFVDEYQDINPAQYRLLRLLTEQHQNICVIGDPDQAIYGFRGASRDFFLKFNQDFPGAKKIQLNHSHRSHQNILQASGQVIAKSPEWYQQKVWSEFLSDTRIDIYRAPTEHAEAEYVVHQIEKMLGGTSYFSLDSGRVSDDDFQRRRTFGDFAVLYRLNIQSKPLEVAFSRSGMPFQSGGEVSFFEKPEISPFLNYLHFMQNPHCDHYLKQILRDAKNEIGPRAIDTLFAASKSQKQSLWQSLTSTSPVPGLTRQQNGAVQKFGQRLKRLQDETSIAQLLERIRTEFYPEMKFGKDKTTGDLFDRLLLRAKPFGNDIRNFLELSAITHEGDDIDARADRISLMTLHAAKGMEFPVVFIIGCEETLIPYQKGGEVENLEEERRLFYVGMTRTREKLILLSSRSRMLFGKMRRNPASRFLKDIEEALKETKQMPYPKQSTAETDPQMNLF